MADDEFKRRLDQVEPFYRGLVALRENSRTGNTAGAAARAEPREPEAKCRANRVAAATPLGSGHRQQAYIGSISAREMKLRRVRHDKCLALRLLATEQLSLNFAPMLYPTEPTPVRRAHVCAVVLPEFSCMTLSAPGRSVDPKPFQAPSAADKVSGLRRYADSVVVVTMDSAMEQHVRPL
jgi:hypothetical protein